MPNFTITTVNQIAVDQRIASASFNLPNNQTLATMITNLLASTPTPGSLADKMKDILTRTNASGSPIRFTITIIAEDS